MKKFALKILSNNKWFYPILFFIICIQILSLSIFMPPWFDIAVSGHYVLNIHPLSTDNKEIFFYGPVFFWMQAFIIKHIAASAFLFRLPVYLCGVASAFILGRIIFLITHKIIIERVFLLLFFTNFLICGSLSCGRMEMMALLFISSSLYFFLNIHLRKSNSILLNAIFSGALFGLSILTTPRSSFLYLLFVLPLFKIFVEGVQTKNLKRIFSPVIHIVLSFVVPYLIWYYPHIGNPFEIFNYITPAAKTQLSFINNRIDINSFAWLLIDTLLLIIAFLKKVKLPFYLWGFFFSCLIFIAVVIPWSYHHGIIVPLLILVAVLCVFFIQQTITGFFSLKILLLTFCIQLLFVSAKYAIIWTDLPSRNNDALQKIIQQYIPQKSMVMGSYNYYYACIVNKCEFRSIEDNTDIATGKPVPTGKKIDYLMNVYKGEYLIVYNSEKNELQSFLETNRFAKIASITIPKKYETLWEKYRRILGLPGYTFYNGSIYKRIDKNY